jgi:hypothetical protein
MRRAERPQESVEQNEKPVGFESEPEENRRGGRGVAHADANREKSCEMGRTKWARATLGFVPLSPKLMYCTWLWIPTPPLHPKEHKKSKISQNMVQLKNY